MSNLDRQVMSELADMKDRAVKDYCDDLTDPGRDGFVLERLDKGYRCYIPKEFLVLIFHALGNGLCTTCPVKRYCPVNDNFCSRIMDTISYAVADLEDYFKEDTDDKGQITGETGPVRDAASVDDKQGGEDSIAGRQPAIRKQRHWVYQNRHNKTEA